MRRLALPSTVGLVVIAALSVSASRPVAVSDAARASSQPRGVVAEDYYRIKSVGAPRLSPDGRWVLFTSSLPVEATNASTVETWVVPADGSASPGAVRHLPSGQAVTNARWTETNELQFSSQNAAWVTNPAAPR